MQGGLTYVTEWSQGNAQVIRVWRGRLALGELLLQEKVSAIYHSVVIPSRLNEARFVESSVIGPDIWRRLGRSRNGDEATDESTKAASGPWIETPSL
jgi:hypothetical protein